MKFTIAGPALSDALRRLSAVVEKRQTIPVLGAIYVEATDGIRLIATNTEISMSIDVPASVAIQGRAVIPESEFSKLAGLAKRNDVEISVAKEVATIAFGTAAAHLSTFAPDDFPLPEFADHLPPADGALVAEALRFCAPAMPREEMKYFLCGVNLCAANGRHYAVATNGHRMHWAELNGTTPSGNGIIPDRAVPIIAETAAADGDFRMMITDRYWAVTSGKIRLRGSVIDGQFPDFLHAAKRDFHHVATVDSSELLSAIEIATIGASLAEKMVPIVVEAADELVVRGFRAGGGAVKPSSTRVRAEIRSPALSCASGAYLAQAVKEASEDSVAISFASDCFLIEPAAQRVDLVKRALVFARRATAEELAA